jgi:hypothetical protein
MSHHLTSDETKLLQIIERLPFSDEDKQQWKEAIDTAGINEETTHAIQARMGELPAPEEHQTVNRARDTANLAALIRRWRLNENLKHVRR